jgi:hypothetical protein
MPIFKRYKIDRYKEVVINQNPGLILDGGFSTYTFDNESNGDFVGIVKDIRLIGEVIEMTMDTGRFSVNQINNTTQLEFDQLVSNGTIRITERPLGWVEMVKTRASFYYEECSPTSFVRKRPVSEHYYDFSTFAFGTSLVAGSGLQDTDIQVSIGEAALRPVGTFDPNIGNNMGVFGPQFNSMDLQSYMRMVINSTISQGQGFIQNQQGVFRSVNGWSPLDGEILRQIQLYLANKDEHFNNQNSQTISSGKYGRARDTIQDGFRASNYLSINAFKVLGNCKETSISFNGSVIVVSPDNDIGTESEPSRGVDAPDTIGDSESRAFCLESNWKTDFSGINNVLAIADPSKNKNSSDLVFPSPKNYDFNFAKTMARMMVQEIDTIYNIRDPREILNDNLQIPQGTLQAQFLDNCYLSITPNTLDKDGNIPEPVGPSRAHNLERIRKILQTNFYFYDKTLFRTKIKKNGIQEYSDGKSFREYAAPSSIGWFHEDFQATHFSSYASGSNYCYSIRIPKDELAEGASSKNSAFITDDTGLTGEYLTIGQDPSFLPDLIGGEDRRGNSGFYKSKQRIYSNDTWKSLIDILRLSKKSAISLIRDNNTDIPIFSDNMGFYDYFYKNDSIPVKIISKSERYFSNNPCQRTIFLGFNDMNVYSYENYNRDFLYILNKEDQLNSDDSIKKRNLSYGKNPLYHLGETNWFDLERFSTPSIKISNNRVYIELKDKTYMMDIYMSLMNAHLAGYSWEIIMKYVELHDSVKNDLILKSQPIIRRIAFGRKVAMPPEISEAEYNNRYNLLLEDIYNRITEEIPFIKNSMIQF